MSYQAHLISIDDLPQATVTLKDRVATRLLAGHPWVYRSEIGGVTGGTGSGTVPAGVALAMVVDARGRFVGHGVLNLRSMIAVRLLSRRRDVVPSRDLVRQNTLRALELRRPMLEATDPDRSACRLVFAEADGLPGLIVDKFGPVLVFQSLAYAAEVCRDDVLAVLRQELNVRRLIERNDASVRDLEGLPQRRGTWPPGGDAPAGDDLVEIDEHGCRYWVDPLGGQKTGFYLDQRDNRAIVRRLAARIAAAHSKRDPDASPSAHAPELSRKVDVLDCFSYTGGFAVAAAVGAGNALGSLVCVDSSAPALELAGRNLSLNGLVMPDAAELVAANAFDYLRSLDQLSGQARRTFDLIVLDPPPFARERRMLDGAIRGYKEINLRAIKLLKPGGYLVTSTCSHYISRESLQQICLDAATDARRTMRIETATVQPADHPVLLGHPEGDYLRCLVLQDVASPA